MRGRLLPILLAALTVLVLGVGAVPAATATGELRVSPGGLFTGTGGSVYAPPVNCGSSRVTGRFTSTGPPLGIIDGITYQNCSGFFAVTVSVDVPWTMSATAYSNGVTTINLTDMAATVTGPGCRYKVDGQASASFDNATSVLTVLHEAATVTEASCLGLISPGQRTRLLSGSYVISPSQVIEPA
ncbi:hypothetical protein JCM33774_89190 [Actinophytocola sp. KF-1]